MAMYIAIYIAIYIYINIYVYSFSYIYIERELLKHVYTTRLKANKQTHRET